MRDRFYFLGYAVILLAAAWALHQTWQRHLEMLQLVAEDGIEDTATKLNSLIEESASHVNMLRISAENTLDDLAHEHQSAPGIYHHVEEVAQYGGYCMDDSAVGSERPYTPGLSGSGPLPQRDSSLGEEVAMALLLGPQLSATADNIPNMAWAYYTSARRFIAMYPFVSCQDFRFSDDLHDHEFFSLGRPEVNPGRSLFWTSAYVDEAGKGLMATIGAPVYGPDQRFRGTVAIDLTLQTLSGYLRSPELEGGTALIVNDREQILAHPSLLGADLPKAPRLADIVPGYDSALRHEIFGGAKGFHAHGGQLVTSQALSAAPWRLVYLTDKGVLYRRAWMDSGIEIAGFVLLVLVIAAFEAARRSGRQLKAHVAELARATQHAQNAQREADAANRAKSQMLANVSHDLRTPLNAIIGFSDVMQRELLGPLGSPRYVGYSQDIKNSGEMLLKIVENLLDLSKVESGQHKLQEEVVDLGVLIEECRHLVEEEVARARIALQASLPRDLPAVRVDPQAIQRVVLNLMSNAIKFTRPGGTVTLSAWSEPEGRISIRVSDTGVGIAEEDQAHLFQPFSRGASAMKANGEGTGLGLSIVKSLIELHGGTVDMKSAPGIGTTVTVHLPPSRNQRTSAQSPAADPAQPRDAA
jgi:signal transduction histidine kinase